MRTRAVVSMVCGLFMALPLPLAAQNLHHDHAGMHAAGMSGMGLHDPVVGRQPVMPGQDIFGAITEIVGILNTDPTTDWSKVDIDALRGHLLDMHLVATEIDPIADTVPGGTRFTLLKSGRAAEAAERMLAAHGPILESEFAWRARLEEGPTGLNWTVTAPNLPEDEARIRALGFFGLLASRAHHQAHHLAMARGEGHAHAGGN